MKLMPSLYTNNKLSETKIKNTMTFAVILKKNKITRVNLTKEETPIL